MEAVFKACPAKEKALQFAPLESQMEEASNWDYAVELSYKENPLDKFSVKGSQFRTAIVRVFRSMCRLW